MVLHAQSFLEKDGDYIPTMSVLDCDEHPEYDFTTERTIEDGLRALGTSLGYSKEELDESIKDRTGRGGPKA